MDIRPYRSPDFDACRALWVELTEHHRTIYETPTIGGDDPGADWDEHLDRVGPENLWVAVDPAGRVVGLTGLIDEPGTVELEPLIVGADRRRSGIGRRLVERVIDEARSRGHTMLSVRPVARNRVALDAFTATGFGTVGHVELFMLLHETDRQWIDGAEIRGVRFEV